MDTKSVPQPTITPETERDSSSKPKYLIFRTSPLGGSDEKKHSNIVVYDSVKMTNLQDGNPNEVFRVFSNSSETEKLFRMKEGADVQYIKIVRQPSMELATLPPPRSNTLYLITEYETIHNSLFTHFADKQVMICTHKDNDFRSIKSTLNSMKHMYDTLLKSDNKQEILKYIHTSTFIDSEYKLFDSASENDVPKPRPLTQVGRESKTIDDLLQNLKKNASDWIIVLDIDNQISEDEFNTEGLNLSNETLSLDPAPTQPSVSTEPEVRS